MATPVIMPRQGQSVESCIIVKWHKKVGDAVKAGDLLFTYETDKASFDEESKIDGILLDIFFAEDADVPVLTNVCVIGGAGEDTAPFRPGGAGIADKEAAVDASADKNDAGKANSEDVAGNVPAEKATKPVPLVSSVSPRAKVLAERAGVDYRGAEGSGPDGRIIEKDIISLQQQGRASTRAASEAGLGGVPAGNGTGIGGRPDYF